jgi:hypothetical protein
MPTTVRKRVRLKSRRVTKETTIRVPRIMIIEIYALIEV